MFIGTIASFWLVSELVWPYFTATVLLLVGVAVIERKGSPAAMGVDRTLALGPLFLAIPMGVFGTDHFIAPTNVAAIVPSWIPGHLFRVYFVGTALIAAALSFVLGKYSTAAAGFLGTMILSFVLLIHIPKLATHPDDRFALAVLFRDSSFSAGAFALFIQRKPALLKGRLEYVPIILRSAVASAAVVFGVEHYLHPQFVPVIPLRQTLPPWIPAHMPLSYLTGTVLLLSGICMLLNWRPRSAATWLAVFVFVIILLYSAPSFCWPHRPTPR